MRFIIPILFLSACVSTQGLRSWEPDYQLTLQGQYDIIGNCVQDELEVVSFRLQARRNTVSKSFRITGFAFSVVNTIPFVDVLFVQTTSDSVTVELRGRATIFNYTYYSDLVLAFIKKCTIIAEATNE